LRDHTEGVWSVAFSLDGRLATASADKTVILWDTATGQKVRTFTQFRGGLRRIALSPDGRRLSTSDRFQMVQVWDTTTRSQLFPLLGHTGQVWGVTFSPDGKFLATAGVDETVKLWNADDTGQLVLTFPGHTSRVHVVAFSPDGRLVASGGADQVVKVWERATGKELLSLPGHTDPGHSDYIFGMAFSPDGRCLASASWREVIVWDAGTGRPIKTLDGFLGTIWSVAFSPEQLLESAMPVALDVHLSYALVEVMVAALIHADVAQNPRERRVPEFVHAMPKVAIVEPRRQLLDHAVQDHSQAAITRQTPLMVKNLAFQVGHLFLGAVAGAKQPVA
jgi:WD40 repeat protein